MQLVNPFSIKVSQCARAQAFFEYSTQLLLQFPRNGTTQYVQYTSSHQAIIIMNYTQRGIFSHFQEEAISYLTQALSTSKRKMIIFPRHTITYTTDAIGY